MSRRLLANLTGNINTGIFLDPANDGVVLWADGKNIVFDPSGPRPADGFSRLFFGETIPLRPIRGVLQTQIGNDRLVFFGNDETLWRYNVDSDVLTDVSKTGGYAGGWWSFGSWGNWVVATNGVDPVQVYKGTTFEDLSHDLGGTLTADIIRIFRSHAILLSGTEILWSDEDDIETWEPEIANAAGSLFVRDLSSDIEAAVTHRRGIVFYGLSTAHILAWSGPPFYFGTERLATNIGALGRNAVCAVGTVHFGMGQDGLWMLVPGQQPEYIDRPALHNYVYRDLDEANQHKSTVWFDEHQMLVIFSYPSKEDNVGEPSRSVALSLRTMVWSPLDFAATGASTTPVLQFATAADLRGGVYNHGVPGAGGGTPFDTQAFISLSDSFVTKNFYGLGGYGHHGYGGPSV